MPESTRFCLRAAMRPLRVMLLIAASLWLASVPHASGTAMPSELARVEAVEGKVYFRARFSTTPANPPWLPVRVTYLLSYGELRTKAKSQLRLRLAERSQVQLLPETEIELDSLRAETDQGATRIVLRYGALRAEIAERTVQDQAFAVHTPAAAVTAQGKTFSVRHDPKKAVTTVVAQDGAVAVRPEGSKLDPLVLGAGQQVSLSLSVVGPVLAAGAPVRLEPPH